jgi:long-subunit acyl-CoA synthetase (AMP-forming)
MAQPQSSSDVALAPHRPVRLERPEIEMERRADGSILMRSRFPLDAYPDRLTDRLVHWAKEAPERVFMAARDGNGEWRKITYARALDYARGIGEALLKRKLSAERPVAILSGNDLEHAMLALGCLYAGVPYAPISPAYSLVSTDYGKLRYIVDLLTPGLVLYNGGSFYIDEGKPLPGAIEHTVRNLKDVAPTWYFNVPKGYEALLPFFRADEQLRRNFFSRLKVLWYAGAAIAQHVFDEMQELAVKTCGERVLFLTGLGSTETAPFAMSRMWESRHGVNIGLPARGCEMKLVPVDGKLEARFRGPNITPGYWRQPELTAKAYDEEGFYKIGDALKFEDENNPIQGFLFDGRIAEDFKLATGTWVSVGPLRAKFIAHFAPYVRDVVIGGADQDYIAVLVVPDVDALRAFAPALAASATPAQVLDHPAVKAKFGELLRAFAKASTGSSNRVLRAILLDEPPSLDLGEITDKGSINQRAVLAHRKALVGELYAETPSARVITADATR